MQNKVFILKDGQIESEVDSLRLTIGAGPDAPELRRSGVWKFMTRDKGTDFFVTSNAIQSEMKGSMHRTRAHFGLSKSLATPPEAWVGELPQSRHYHVLEIPELAEGDYKHVLRVAFPGFALLSAPQPLQPGKRITLIEPPSPNHEISLGITVVEGDWHQFQPERDSDKYVGLLTGDSDRYALVSVMHRAFSDTKAVIQNINRNLGLIDSRDREIPDKELSTLLWMDREPDQPISIIELNNVRRTTTK